MPKKAATAQASGVTVRTTADAETATTLSCMYTQEHGAWSKTDLRGDVWHGPPVFTSNSRGLSLRTTASACISST
jgi:hypothetical protein